MISTNNIHIQMSDGSTPSYQNNSKLTREFTVIQKMAKEVGVTPDNAINFINSLSDKDRDILARFHGLYDGLSTDNLSKEGAYNLLQLPAKQVDLDKNGVTNIGSQISVTFPPVNFPQGVSQAYTDALYKMQEKGASTTELYAFSFSVFEAQTAGSLVQALSGSEGAGFDFLSNRFNAIANAVSGTPKSSFVEEFSRVMADSRAELDIATREAATLNDEQANYMEQFNAYEMVAKMARGLI